MTQSEQGPEKPVFDLTLEAQPHSVVRLSPLVRRIVCGNPGPFTFKGTNTYLVGAGDVTVIDPGPDDAAHRAALLAALAGERVARILITHTHRDHSPGAAALSAATGAPIEGCAPYAPVSAENAEAPRLDASHDRGYAPSRIWTDGDVATIGGATLTAVATPGHASNHLAFALAEEAALFSGDHVMAWSTSIVAPPDGSMAAYMASLERLRTRDETIYWPGHGGPVREPARFVRALASHRRQREAAILARLTEGPATIPVIVDRSYAGLDARLKGAAALSTLAHVEDLLARGLIAADGPATLGALYRLA